MPIKNRFAELHPEIAEWRRDIHAHPELGFETHRTAALVAGKLRDFGVDEVVEGIGRTGVVGIIRGRSTASGRVVGLRADMDALPIEEIDRPAPCLDQPEGKMHACGHDGHTAMLLGAARYLAETRNFDGTAVVIFQPAEEGEGGAARDGRGRGNGALRHRARSTACTTGPGCRLGQFAIRHGAVFRGDRHCSTSTVDRASGGHAAKPQDVVDTTLDRRVACGAGVADRSCQRNADPVEQARRVRHDPSRQAAKAFNVIPQTVDC